MTIHINLYWDVLNPRWERFNKTKLAQTLECSPSKAVIRFTLVELEDGKLGIMDKVPAEIVGEIGFTPAGLREILGVKRLTSDMRKSRKTHDAVNNYILSLQ